MCGMGGSFPVYVDHWLGSWVVFGAVSTREALLACRVESSPLAMFGTVHENWQFSWEGLLRKLDRAASQPGSVGEQVVRGREEGIKQRGRRIFYTSKVEQSPR